MENKHFLFLFLFLSSFVVFTLNEMKSANAAYTYTCNDSDYGINYDVKGNISVVFTDNIYNISNIWSQEDYCTGNNLTENYCRLINSSSYWPAETQNFTCINGCSNGACIKQNQTNITGSMIVSSNIASYVYIDNAYKGCANCPPGFGDLSIYNIALGLHAFEAFKSIINGSGFGTSFNVNDSHTINTTLYFGPTTVTYSCSDSDNGLNYNTRGTVNLSQGICEGNSTVCFDGTCIDGGGSCGGGFASKTDYCASLTNLTEYYCQTPASSAISSVSRGCKCSGGACITATRLPPPKPPRVDGFASPPISNGISSIAGVVFIAVGALLLLWAVKRHSKPNSKKEQKPKKKKRR